MTQMVDWLKTCAAAIISLFSEGINMPGKADTSYTKDMTPTLQQRIYLSQDRK